MKKRADTAHHAITAQEREQVKTNLDNVIGVVEAGGILGITPRRVRALARTQLEGKKVGHDFVFWKPFVETFKTIPRPRGRRPKAF